MKTRQRKDQPMNGDSKKRGKAQPALGKCFLTLQSELGRSYVADSEGCSKWAMQINGALTQEVQMMNLELSRTK
jgi:hypothetical protein